MKKLRYIKHISLGAKKAYDKTQHSFMIKSSASAKIKYTMIIALY